MRDVHIGENAELYALGSLGDLERAQVEAHVANCAECLRRVGEAEETVLGLERETAEVPLPSDVRAPEFRSRRPVARWWMGAVAAAAALIIGYLLPHPGLQPTARRRAGGDVAQSFQSLAVRWERSACEGAVRARSFVVLHRGRRLARI